MLLITNVKKQEEKNSFIDARKELKEKEILVFIR